MTISEINYALQLAIRDSLRGSENSVSIFKQFLWTGHWVNLFTNTIFIQSSQGPSEYLILFLNWGNKLPEIQYITQVSTVSKYPQWDSRESGLTHSPCSYQTFYCFGRMVVLVAVIITNPSTLTWNTKHQQNLSDKRGKI